MHTGESQAGVAQEGAPAAVSQRASSRRWVVVGIIALLVLLVIAYVVGGAALAAGPVSRADQALKSTVDHNNTIAGMFQDDPFRNVDFGSSTFDPTAAKNALGIVSAEASRWQEMITGDRGALQKVDGQLHTSVLTLPENSTIGSRKTRVDAGLRAMATAQKALDLFRNQIAFLRPLMDVAVGFQAVGRAADASDVGAMQSSLATTASGLQQAMTLSSAASVPPPLSDALNALQKTVSDLQALVAAVQARDVSAIDADLARVDADSKVLDAIDGKAIDRAETALIQPLSDAYDRDMKIVAGG